MVSGRKEIDEEMKKKIRKIWKEEGIRVHLLAKRFGVCSSTISKVLKEANNEESMD